MTTVGYGDINGSFSLITKSYVMFAQFIGILSFALIKDRVFNSKHQNTVNDLVNRASDDMINYLNSLNTLRKNIDIDADLIDETIDYVQNSQRYSTRVSLYESEFWNSLSINLQNRLFMQVMGRTVSRFNFFFNDYNLRNFAPKQFI